MKVEQFQRAARRDYERAAEPSPPDVPRLMSHKSLMSHVQGWPQRLEKEAYYGVAGEIVRAIEPHTEADPAALLIQLLVAFGSAVGRGPYFPVEADRHHPNLFCCVAGETSKARKGTIGDPVADRVLLLLRDKPDGMTRNDIVRSFSGHKGKEQIDRALDSLLRLKRAAKHTLNTGGRPAEVWVAIAT